MSGIFQVTFLGFGVALAAVLWALMHYRAAAFDAKMAAVGASDQASSARDTVDLEPKAEPLDVHAAYMVVGSGDWRRVMPVDEGQRSAQQHFHSVSVEGGGTFSEGVIKITAPNISTGRSSVTGKFHPPKKMTIKSRREAREKVKARRKSEDAS